MFFLFFFLIGALGYLWQDAINAAIYKADDIPFPVLINLILYALVCASAGTLFGIIFHWLSGKIKPKNQINFINISLLFCLLLLSSIIIAKPFYDGLKLFQHHKKNVKVIGIVRNELGLVKLDIERLLHFKPKTFEECMAFDIRDTVDVFVDGANTITIRQASNNKFYTYKIPNDQLTDVKATLIKGKKGQTYLVMLALMRPISGYSVLLVFNKYEQCVYEEVFASYTYGLSKNNKNEILLSRQDLNRQDYIYKPQYVLKF